MSPEAVELAKSYHDRLGSKTRRLLYHWSLPNRRLMTWTARQNVGSMQVRVLQAGYPLFRRALVQALGVVPEKAERDLAKSEGSSTRSPSAFVTGGFS
ncbi:MAG: hypothetical protein ACOC1F_12680 [Myxococcota bacterium]